MGMNAAGVPAMAAVLGPVTDEAGGAHLAPLGTSQPLAGDGIIDVTKPPFDADPTGATDSTVAIQRAVDYARAHYAVAYFPVGEYLVSIMIVGVVRIVRIMRIIVRSAEMVAQHPYLHSLPPPPPQVSDTIVVQQTFRQMATGGVPGPFKGGITTDFLLDGVSSRYVPNYLR
jgi:hypothetical protein